MTSLTSRVAARAGRSSPLGRAVAARRRSVQAVITLSSLSLLGLMVGVGVMLWLRSGPTRAAAGWSFITSTDMESGRPGVRRSALHRRHAHHIARRAGRSPLPLGLGIAIFLAELCPAAVAHRPGLSWSNCWPPSPASCMARGAFLSSSRRSSQPRGQFSDEHLRQPGKFPFLPIFQGPFFGASSLAAG